MTAPLITLLAMPKPFQGHIGIIQRNAITSWTKLQPRPDIYLFGEEEGVADLAAELGIGHLQNIARNEFGTPMLDDLFHQAGQLAKTPLLCYANSDIILLQEFVDAVQRIYQRFPKFLAVAHRLNINVTEQLDFATDGEAKLRHETMPLGKPGDDTAIDVFVFPPQVYREVPPLAIGRAWFDQWLIKDALRQKIPVVDVTLVARAIHQNHDYAHIDGGQRGAYWGEEARRSLVIYGGVPHAFTLLDVTHELLPDSGFRRVRFRRRRAAIKEWIWRRLIVPTSHFRRRLGLSRAASQKMDKNQP